MLTINFWRFRWLLLWKFSTASLAKLHRRETQTLLFHKRKKILIVSLIDRNLFATSKVFRARKSITTKWVFTTLIIIFRADLLIWFGLPARAGLVNWHTCNLPVWVSVFLIIFVVNITTQAKVQDVQSDPEISSLNGGACDVLTKIIQCKRIFYTLKTACIKKVELYVFRKCEWSADLTWMEKKPSVINVCTLWIYSHVAWLTRQCTQIHRGKKVNRTLQVCSKFRDSDEMISTLEMHCLTTDCFSKIYNSNCIQCKNIYI